MFEHKFLILYFINTIWDYSFRPTLKNIESIKGLKITNKYADWKFDE